MTQSIQSANVFYRKSLLRNSPHPQPEILLNKIFLSKTSGQGEFCSLLSAFLFSKLCWEQWRTRSVIESSVLL